MEVVCVGVGVVVCLFRVKVGTIKAEEREDEVKVEVVKVDEVEVKVDEAVKVDVVDVKVDEAMFVDISLVVEIASVDNSEEGEKSKSDFKVKI